MDNLVNKKILLIICGGISAYKTLELIRSFKKKGVHIKTILTKSAKKFVTPLSISSLSKEKVYEEVLEIVSNSTKPLIRKAAGSNKNASLAILAQLNDDGDSKQRAWKYILRNWGEFKNN